MKLKFWKKDEFSDFKLPPLENNLGLSGGNEHQPGGLDLTGGFQPGAMSPPGMNSPSSFQPSSFPQSNFSPAAQSQFGMHDEDHAPTQPQGNLHGKDLEVIAAKLDAIKSQLDMLNLRIGTLEQRLPTQQQETGGPRKPWY